MEDPFSSRTAGFHLPQWSRVAHLETFNLPPNRNMQLLPPIEGRQQLPTLDADEADGGRSLEERRISYLEKSLNFLRVQHDEMLQSLQLEIERLRQENKDLQYRAVMTTKSTSATAPAQPADPVQPSRLPRDLDLEAAEGGGGPLASGSGGLGLQEQMRLVQRQLADERRQRQALQSLLEQQTEQLHRENKAATAVHGSVRFNRRGQELRLRATQAESVAACPPELHLRNLRVRFDPLRIAQAVDATTNTTGSNSSRSEAPDESGGDRRVDAAAAASASVEWRAPSLMECELLVKQLTGDNRRQAAEIARLKVDVRDVAYNAAYKPHRLPSLAARPQPQSQPQPPPHLLLAGENVASRQLHQHQQQQLHQQQQQHLQLLQPLPELATALATAAAAGGSSRAADRRRRTQILRTGKQ